MNSKVVLVIAICFTIGFISLYFVNDILRPYYDRSAMNKLWLSQEFHPDSKRIFILGSSHVGKLNFTSMTEILEANNLNYELHRRNIPGIVLEEQIFSLNDIIRIKPDLVVIGIRYQDFSDWRNEKYDSNMFASPIEKLIPFGNFTDFNEIRNRNSIININNFENPKLTTFNIISWVYNQEIPKIPQLTTETPKIDKRDFIIEQTHDIFNEKDYPNSKRKFVGEIKEGSVGEEFLRYFIKELKNEGIQIVIFSTPHHQIFRDSMEKEDFENFRNALLSIDEEYDVTVGFFDDKYSELDIWTNPDHVAHHPRSQIFSDDVAKLLIEELS